jgi:protein-L-isoaspartate(D-aspartate) O-methyltransferase
MDKKIKDMIRTIEREVEYTSDMIGREALDARVLRAMRKVPRHEFIPKHQQDMAYYDGAVPIGCGQTISQPYIVALMTDLLGTEKADIILEVGTGSGYQAAVLSQLVHQVYTIENIPELAESARTRLDRLGYRNVEVRTGDGYYGWPEHAPFDGIIVTAAAPHVPRPLIDQLKPGARLVIPVDTEHWAQTLKVIEKRPDGGIEERALLAVAFVPLTGIDHNQPMKE